MNFSLVLISTRQSSTGQRRRIAWTVLVIAGCLLSHGYAQEFSSPTTPQRVDKTLDIPVASLCENALTKGDTVQAVECLLNAAVERRRSGSYADSYQKLWEALLLADQAQLHQQRVFIYHSIGRYYGYYKRLDRSIAYLNKAKSINWELVKKGLRDSSALATTYMHYCNVYREFGEASHAQNYLDSCALLAGKGLKSSVHPWAIMMQQGFIHVVAGRYAEAIQSLTSAESGVIESDFPLLVLVYAFLGDAYDGLADQKRAQKLYEEAISISKEHQRHRDFSILIYDKLAALYRDQGKLHLAYEQLKRADELEDLYFDSRSEYNKSLLQIQDEFQAVQATQEQLLQDKLTAETERMQSKKILRYALAFSIVGFLLLISILIMMYIRNKHRVEKQLIAIEIENNHKLLELRNRELAASTLKLVEKDQFLRELQDRADHRENGINKQEIDHLIKVASNNGDTWQAFESQFVNVNPSFYEDLRVQYPSLTPGERRLCALIKLNLSSKEIAGLQHISVESVHKSRYRLRKKLGIQKDVDLGNFIDDLTR